MTLTQTERMARRFEKHSECGIWLRIVFRCAKPEGPAFSLVQIGYLKIKMHLLRPFLSWPRRSLVILNLLEGDHLTGLALDFHPGVGVIALLGGGPVEQLAVEIGKLLTVWTVKER